ncbi:unnamed protein product [Protopolystoma xenopodis]|uniref:Uncharacterized protein n=1 Tax=Protopolystoma xenopodis TaxID=117903 RepID=A0A448XQI4_9PLAT|nr:unnamed protein product [Protopolystoma xenopodis]
MPKKVKRYYRLAGIPSRLRPGEFDTPRRQKQNVTTTCRSGESAITTPTSVACALHIYTHTGRHTSIHRCPRRDDKWRIASGQRRRRPTAAVKGSPAKALADLRTRRTTRHIVVQQGFSILLGV